MATQSGLTRRRGAGGASEEGEGGSSTPSRIMSPGPQSGNQSREVGYDEVNGHKIAYDPRDISESAERIKQPKLTLMEEVLLLGLKDKQVYFSKVLTHMRNRADAVTRVCSRSGMTISRTPSEAVLCSNWLSGGGLVCRKTQHEEDTLCQTE
jgi:hypothetical protein